MIIIEANEIPKSVFLHYAKTNKGPLSSSIKKFGIVDSLLDDVEEKYLYPSQAWASISTGLHAKKHGIRWYNDAKSTTRFYWREASQNLKKVAIMNVLHSGSISEEEVKNYDFLFPDFFSCRSEGKYKKIYSFSKFQSSYVRFKWSKKLQKKKF